MMTNDGGTRKKQECDVDVMKAMALLSQYCFGAGSHHASREELKTVSVFR